MNKQNKKENFWAVKSGDYIIPVTIHWHRDGAIESFLKLLTRSYKTSKTEELFRDLIGAEWIYKSLQAKRKKHNESEWKTLEEQGCKVVQIKIIEV